MYDAFVLASFETAALGTAALISFGMIGGTILAIIDYVKDKRNESR